MKESRNRKKKSFPRIGHLTQEGEPVAVPPAFPQGSQAKTSLQDSTQNLEVKCQSI